MPTYYIKGSTSRVTLTDREFVAAGGEKNIFAKAGTAYCVYHNPKQAIPVGKIHELAGLQHPGVVLPTAELLDANKRHCGEVMKFVEDSYAPKSPDIKPLVLCQLFTNAFRRKQNIEPADVVRITDQLLEIVRHCHASNVVLVDPNETNWLIRHDLRFTYLIDTSCVQTASYPGTAIKPAIRDWNTHAFTPESDWFSIAVVLGWLWAGIHPYTAFHPDWKHLDANAAMIPRMKANHSFFRQGTEFNRACRPLTDIPNGLRLWLADVLEKGKRYPGPDNCGTVSVQIAVAKPSQPVSTGVVELHEIEDAGRDITGAFGRLVATDGRQFVFTPQQDLPVEASVASDGMLALTCRGPKPMRATDRPIDIAHRARRVFVTGNRIYAVGETAVSEVVFNEVNGTVRATVRKVGSIADLPTTRVYPGCVVQNLLGKYLLSIFPESGKCYQHQLPELEGWQILDAKCESGVFVVCAEQHGQYKMLMYRIGQHALDSVEICREHSDVNFAVTDRGIVAIMEPGGMLRICSNRIGSTNIRRIQFPEPDMLLFARDNKIVGAMGSRLYDIIMK